MGIQALDQLVHDYNAHSLALSTLAVYRSVASTFVHFCISIRCTTLPLQQETVLRFVVHLATTGITYQSIITYLSGVRFLQITNGFPDPGLSSLL